MEKDRKTIHKKANFYFFSKVVFNIFLMVIGALLISAFLRQIQQQASLQKQEENSRLALSETISLLEQSSEEAETLTAFFHKQNQDTLEDLRELMDTELFSSLSGAGIEARTELMSGMTERSGVELFFIMSNDGRVIMSARPELRGARLVRLGFMTEEDLQKLVRGTLLPDGSIDPVLTENSYGRFYCYSEPYSYRGTTYTTVLGADASVLELRTVSLEDFTSVLQRAAVINGGFMFAVDAATDSYLYYEHGNEVLTGTNVHDSGLSRDALRDDYAGRETINGTEYFCVSKTFRDSTIICAVADTARIFANDRYVLVWSVSGFVMVMLLCLAYSVIVRNDFVRHEVKTNRKVLSGRDGMTYFFDKSIFMKTFPLMLLGVLLIFGISFYTQTLLEISQCIDSSVVALEEVNGRYADSISKRTILEDYYHGRFVAKARLISYLLEENPAVLNEPSDRYFSVFDEQGNRQYLTDEYGNRIKSIASSAGLQELCENNDVESIYVFDEEGHAIATNTANWYFVISHDPEDQSYPFLEVLDGKKDVFVQEAMVNDLGENTQFIGVSFNYFTTEGSDGSTLYVSRLDYDKSREAPSEEPEPSATDPESDAETFPEADSENVPEIQTQPVLAHRSLLQIGLNAALSDRILASTEPEYIFSGGMLKGGFLLLFDASEDHICVYSPNEAQIGLTAEELGVSVKAFSGNDYYCFSRINGTKYFQYFRYADGYFIATAYPRSSMYQSRTSVSLITSFTSLFLILILSFTVTFTTEEEELLYATISEEQSASRLNAAIFSVILPSGRRASTTKASARWDNRRVTWSELAPEQKLLVILSILGGVLFLYVILTIIGVRISPQDGSVIRYIISGNWDKGFNIFSLSACALLLIFTAIAIALFRIPIRILSAVLGTRSETVGHLMLSIVKYGGTIGAIIYCLYLLGMDMPSMLAGVGVLSLIIGLGAQSLIKDILAGISIVFDGEFRVGDIITIDSYRGTVMDIGLRTTKILGVDGNIKIYNNSEISGVLNMTQQASVAATTISIEYGQDIDYVEEVLRRELPAIKENNPKILDGPTYLGVSNLGESGVDITVIARGAESDIKGITRYLNREVLKIFYRNGINVPFPNVTVSNLDMTGRKTIKDLFPDQEQDGGSEK